MMVYCTFSLFFHPPQRVLRVSAEYVSDIPGKARAYTGIRAKHLPLSTSIHPHLSRMNLGIINVAISAEKREGRPASLGGDGMHSNKTTTGQIPSTSRNNVQF